MHVPSTTQGVRQRAFEVLLELVSPSTSTSAAGGDGEAEALRPLLDMGADFLRCVALVGGLWMWMSRVRHVTYSKSPTQTHSGVLDCMEGEKDPRCLILCLRVLGRTQALFPQASDELAEACFDVTACYFPITFTPPPNDPYGITPEMLSHALRATLTARCVVGCVELLRFIRLGSGPATDRNSHAIKHTTNLHRQSPGRRWRSWYCRCW